MTRTNPPQEAGPVSGATSAPAAAYERQAPRVDLQQRLLILEQDAATRGKLVRALQRPGTEIIAAATLGDAESFIAREQPDLVLAALSPDSGIEVFTQLPMIARTTFTARCVRSYRQRIGRWLASGATPEVNHQLLHCNCQKPPSRPVPLSLADCIPLAALTHSALRIELVQRDQCVGEVLVANGEVRACADAEGSGEPALTRLLGLERALARCSAAAPEDLTLASSIDWLTMLFVNAPVRWQKDAYPSDTPLFVDAISTDSPTTRSKTEDDVDGAQVGTCDAEQPELGASKTGGPYADDPEVGAPAAQRPDAEADARSRDEDTPWDRCREIPASLSSGIFDLHRESFTCIQAIDSDLFTTHQLHENADAHDHEAPDTAQVFVLDQHRLPVNETDDDVFTSYTRRMQALGGSSPFSDAMPQARPAVPPRPNKTPSRWPSGRDDDGDAAPEASSATTHGGCQTNKAERAFDRGLFDLREGRFEAALRAWTQASELDPDNTHYRVNLRMLRRRIDEHGQHLAR